MFSESKGTTLKRITFGLILLSLCSVLSSCGNAELSSTTPVAAAATTTSTTFPPGIAFERDLSENISESVRIEQEAFDTEQLRKFLNEDHAAKVKAARDARIAAEAREAELRAKSSRGAPRSTQTISAPSGDFWRRLANCESATGEVGTFVGYFQFSWTNARTLGIDGSESYETQKEAAIKWLGIINAEGKAGNSKSGWPHCWNVAAAG